MGFTLYQVDHVFGSRFVAISVGIRLMVGQPVQPLGLHRLFFRVWGASAG
jgi:hypothetical protein